MIGMVRLHGLLILCCALGACYNPSYGDCQVSCASGMCPAGLSCQSGVCRAEGMSGPCTTPDAGGDGGGSGSIPLDMLTELQLDSLCATAVRCGQFEDEPSCKATYGSILVQQSDVAAAVNAGSVIYHGDKARECLDAQDTNPSCERWKYTSNRVTNPVCNEIFEGTRHADESCAMPQQCISQNCMLPASGCTTGTCCEGTCLGDEPPGPRNVGAPCTYADQCMNGYCDQSTGVCAEYKMAGTPCTYGDQCADGLVCDSTNPNAICQQPVATGGQCTSLFVCALLGDVCQNGACVTGGLMGSSCANQQECQQLHACTNNVCGPLPDIGGNCLNVGMCNTGYCQYPQGVCTAKVVNDGPCSPNMGSQQCESGYCDPVGTCMTKPICN